MIISTATANPVLSVTLNKFFQATDGFVGRRIAPIIRLANQSAKYYVFDKDNMISIPKLLERAPSTPYNRTSMKLSDDSYNCVNRGIEIPVDDEERSKYAVAFSADSAAMNRARNIMIVNHEYRVKAMFDANTVSHATPVIKWNAGNADLVGDIDAAKEVIHNACGLDPNLMILPRPVWLAIKEHPKIAEKIKYSERAVTTKEILQEIFGIGEIVIPGVIDNGAADGQAPAPSQIWGKNVYLLHAEQTEDLQAPNFARTFVWTAETGPDGVTVESYRQDEIQSDIHRAKQYTDEKVTGVELAYRLDAAIE